MDDPTPRTTANPIKPLHGSIGISTMLPGQVGLIAMTEIPKGMIIGHTPPDLIELLCPWEEYDKIDPATKAWADDFCLGTPDGAYIIGNPNMWPMIWHMNHSCNGNVGFDNEDNFVALRTIQSGEEIHYDYGLAESGPRFDIVCKCGSANCRGRITGEDWKMLGEKPSVRENMISYLRAEFDS